METWRLYTEYDREVSVGHGLAVDDTLALSISEHGGEPILHLYTFEPCAIVGRYQDIEAALNIPRCEELKISYNRRSTGGGTVIMGPKVIALGLGLPRDHWSVRGEFGKIFQVMSRVFIRMLKKFGVKGEFRPKNDIEVNGKKIAGLSASKEFDRAILFHTSFLVEFDVPLMLEIMRLPTEKLYDKGFNCFSERLTDLSREVGQPVPIMNAFEALRFAFEEELGVTLKEDTLSPWEVDMVKKLEKTRYSDPKWIFSRRHPRSRMIEVTRKTRAGLIQLFLSFAGNALEYILITGDFFSTTKEIQSIESALRWSIAERENILRNLDEVWHDEIIHNLKKDEFIDLILEGKEKAFLSIQKVGYR